MPSAAASRAIRSASPTRRAANFGLVVLTGINLFNYIDRYVVSGIEESIKADLHLSDTQSGALMTAVIVLLMLASPWFGTRGDRGSRTRLIAAGVALWSVATASAGLAVSFVTLILARATVGVGEAAYGTIAPSLLADYYPKNLRGRVFSVFFAAIPIGAALGFLIGGLVDKHYGWRAAFFVAGLPGLVLAGLLLLLPDPPRGRADEAVPEASPRAAGFAAFFDLARNRGYVLVVLGYAAYTFAVGGLGFWMVPFLVRMRGVPKAAAAVQIGAVLVGAGFLGTAVGGWLGDLLLKRSERAYEWVAAATTLAALPCALVAIVVHDPRVYLPAVFLAEVFLFASTGPVNTAIVNMVPPTLRATAMAGSVFTIHILGDAISPTVIGLVSDATNLGLAVLVVPLAIGVSATLWTSAALRR